MPGTRWIYTGISRSPGSARALRQTAQLAHHDALLIPVLAWLRPTAVGSPARAAPDLARRRQAAPLAHRPKPRSG
jgi:hypothetical protein